MTNFVVSQHIQVWTNKNISLLRPTMFRPKFPFSTKYHQSCDRYESTKLRKEFFIFVVEKLTSLNGQNVEHENGEKQSRGRDHSGFRTAE